MICVHFLYFVVGVCLQSVCPAFLFSIHDSRPNRELDFLQCASSALNAPAPSLHQLNHTGVLSSHSDMRADTHMRVSLGAAVTWGTSSAESLFCTLSNHLQDVTRSSMDKHIFLQEAQHEECVLMCVCLWESKIAFASMHSIQCTQKGYTHVCIITAVAFKLNSLGSGISSSRLRNPSHTRHLKTTSTNTSRRWSRLFRAPWVQMNFFLSRLGSALSC